MRVLQLDNCRGAVLILVAAGMTVLLGMAGLALDAGMAYGVKAKLSAALDAAAIAAAKASSVGQSQGERTRNARLAAERFFAANYPEGYLGSNPKFGDVNVRIDEGRVIVKVSASAVEPTVFMRVMGLESISVNAEAEVVRQDLDMAFVVDNTGSLYTNREMVKSSAKTFIEKFNDRTDRVALIRFAYGAAVDVPIRRDRRGFDSRTVINRIESSSFSGHTNFAEGFRQARSQLNSIPETNRSSLRVIVFFTDGAPNTFSSTFVFDGPSGDGRTRSGSVRTGDLSSGTERGLWRYDEIIASAGTYNDFSRYVSRLPVYYDPQGTGDTEFRLYPGSKRSTTSAVTYSNINRISRNLPEDMAAAARQQGIYVFTLGLGRYLTDPSGPDGENGEDILLRMANDRSMLKKGHLAADFRPSEPAGQYCFAANTSQLDACYDRLASAIMRLSM